MCIFAFTATFSCWKCDWSHFFALTVTFYPLKLRSHGLKYDIGILHHLPPFGLNRSLTITPRYHSIFFGWKCCCPCFSGQTTGNPAAHIFCQSKFTFNVFTASIFLAKLCENMAVHVFKPNCDPGSTIYQLKMCLLLTFLLKHAAAQVFSHQTMSHSILA